MAADVVTDLASAAPLSREILAHNPVHGRNAKIRHAADGTPVVDDLRAGLARGLAVVVLRPATHREPATHDSGLKRVSVIARAPARHRSTRPPRRALTAA